MQDAGAFGDVGRLHAFMLLSEDADDWARRRLAVLAANGGTLPDCWLDAVLYSGLARAKQAEFDNHKREARRLAMLNID